MLFYVKHALTSLIMVAAIVLPVGSLAQAVPVSSPLPAATSSPVPSPSSAGQVAFVALPCPTLLRQAGLSFRDRVTPKNVGRLFGAALELRGASGKNVPRVVFDEAYADVLACFTWTAR